MMLVMRRGAPVRVRMSMSEVVERPGCAGRLAFVEAKSYVMVGGGRVRGVSGGMSSWWSRWSGASEPEGESLCVVTRETVGEGVSNGEAKGGSWELWTERWLWSEAERVPSNCSVLNDGANAGRCGTEDTVALILRW